MPGETQCPQKEDAIRCPPRPTLNYVYSRQSYHNQPVGATDSNQRPNKMPDRWHYYVLSLMKQPPFFVIFLAAFSSWKRNWIGNDKRWNPCNFKAFSVCHYYTVRAHLYNKPVGKWGATKRRAGTSWTFRCKYHNECICPRYQRGKEKISEATGYGSRAVKNLPLFRLVRAKTRAKHKDLAFDSENSLKI